MTLHTEIHPGLLHGLMVLTRSFSDGCLLIACLQQHKQ
jgi:hypothetical protein